MTQRRRDEPGGLPPGLTPIRPKAVAYALHLALYGRHQNPRKCARYNTTPCPGCGVPHPCPATN